MSPVAENYWVVSGYVIFWVLFAVAIGLFAQRACFLVRLLKLGRPDNRFDRLAYRSLSTLGSVFTQSGNLKNLTLKDPAALGHSIMFWGLMMFGLAYPIFIGLAAGFGLYSILGGSPFETMYISVLDVVALLVILAMGWVVVKRYLIVPERLRREMSTAEKIIQPILILVIIGLMMLHFGIEGFRYATYGIPDPGPPAGVFLAQSLVNAGISRATSAAVYKSLWWLNYVLLLAAVIYAPYSKHLHPLTSFANIFFRNLEPKGSLEPVDLTKPGSLGAGKIQDFSWKQLLDLYSCTWCGRCHVVCPAQVSGKPLSPRELILGMREHLLEEGPELLKKGSATLPITLDDVAAAAQASEAQPSRRTRALIGGVITEEAIWSCTTCQACQEVCPVDVEHVGKIVDLRRHLQMVASTEVARDPLKNLRVRGNPWRGTMYSRMDWTEGLDVKVVGEDGSVDILYWVGCTEALEERSLRVAQAVARLMIQAGVDFGILGEEEICCGDPARRLGAEHLFQMLAANNIRLLQIHNIKTVVTACPHCFNTLKNEYPRMGGQFEVIHHTQFIAGLIKEKRLKIKPSAELLVTYQEPCYLGRYNDIYETPREVLDSIPGVTRVEMEQNRKHGFCCGGGGGRMWLEEKIDQRISAIRLGQARDARAQVVSTACPFCLQMLEDAAKEKDMEGSLKIKDIAELVADSLEVPKHNA